MRLVSLVLLLASPALWLAPHAQTYTRALDPEGDPSLHDLDWRDGALWATDTGADRVVRIDPTTGAVSQPTALAFDPRGLAWDGTNYRVSTGFDSSAPEILTFSAAGTTLGAVPAPSALTNGLTVHDGLLWAANAYPDGGNSLVGLDPATGAVVETIPFPSTQPTGIAFLPDGTLWASNAGDDSGSSGVYTLYHLDRATGAVLGSLGAPEGATRPRGLAYDPASGALYVTVRTVAVPQVSLIYEIDLGGAGNAQVSVSPESFDFGAVPFNTTETQTLTVSNTGDAPLTISDVQIAWILIGDAFATTTLAEQTIAPGATVTAEVTYHAGSENPMQVGSGMLMFTTNDVNRPSVELPITGIPSYPDPTLRGQTAYSFGPVTVDPGARAVAVWTAEFRNAGALPLTVTGATFTDPAFSLYDADALPLTIAPAATVPLRIAFRPDAVRAYSATLSLASDDPASPFPVALTGEGVSAGPTDGGSLVWQHDVPERGSSDLKVTALFTPGDLTGDGHPDVVYTSRTYATRALDASSLAQGGPTVGYPVPAALWAFDSCPSNDNCGAVSGNAQLYDTGLDAADLTADGVPDLVIGTEGGNDHVYALDGATGATLWGVGSDTDPYLASYNSVSARLDATGDGVPDVATGTGSASPESPNPVNHRRVYLLDGTDGSVVWERPTALPNFRTSLFGASDGARVASGGAESSSTFVTAWRADGSQAWSVGTGSLSPFLVEPVTSDACAGCEDLLVAGLGAGVRRLSGETGATLWTGATVGSSTWDLALLARPGAAPLVVAGTSSSVVSALDGATGATVWEASAGDQAFAVEAVPDGDGDGTDDVLVAGKAGVALLLSGATGAERWRYVFGDGAFETSGETATAVGDLDGDGAVEVAVGTRDGRVILLRGATPSLPGTEGGPDTPAALVLDAPVPNPTAGAVMLRYRLHAPATVRLRVLDALGREVWASDAGVQPAGSYAVAGPARLAAGVYVVRAETGEAVATTRLTVAR